MQEFLNADWAIILGSGLSFDLPFMVKKEIPYSQIDGLPEPKVQGHKGMAYYYELENRLKVVVFSGRFHLYEGRSVKEVQSIIDLIYNSKIKNILITNAAGGISKNLQVTDLMLINQIKDFQNNGDLSEPMGLLNCLDKNTLKISGSLFDFLKQELKLIEGSYAAVLGPNYETFSEINLFKLFNCSAVGMSTYLEVKRALELNLNIAAVSAITNLWSQTANPSHAEVLENSSATLAKLNKLFCKILNLSN